MITYSSKLHAQQHTDKGRTTGTVRAVIIEMIKNYFILLREMHIWMLI